MANKPLTTFITIGGTLTSGLKSALGTTASMLAGVGKSVDALTLKQTTLALTQTKLQASGRGFDVIRKSAERLRLEYRENAKALGALLSIQGKLKRSQEQQERSKAAAAIVGTAGTDTGATGKAILGSIIPGIKEAKQYDTAQSRVRALGLGEQANQRAFKFASAMKQFGLSQVDKLELMRDAMGMFGDERQAEMMMPLLGKMKFGNMAVFGKEKGEENVAALMEMMKVVQMRGGLDSAEAFEKQANIVQRMISLTGGRVGATEWKDLLQQSGVMGKSMDSETLFHSMLPLIQKSSGKDVGTGLGAVYNSMYQGTMLARQFGNIERLGLIGDKTKVIKSDKSGRMTHINPGALLGADLFKTDIVKWMDEILLPQLAKNGITDEKQIMDTFGMISSDAVSSNFLADIYKTRAASARARKNGANAQDANQLDAEGQKSVAGKEAQITARLGDTRKVLGNHIMPLYTGALTLATNALDRFNKFSERNPKLTGALVIGVTALGVGLATVGPLLLAGAGAIRLFGASQLLLTRVLVGGGVSGEIGMMGRALAGLQGIVPVVMGIFRPLATMFMMSAMPMAGFILAAVAIAGVGLVIRNYWEPLKAFFSSFGSAFMAGIAPVGQAILAAFAPFWSVLKPIVMPLLEAIGGFVKRIGAWFGELLTPLSATSQEATNFGNAGKVCGEVVAGAFRFMLMPITLVLGAIKWISENIGGVIDKTMRLGSTAGSLLSGGWDIAKSLFKPPTPVMAAMPALPPVRGVGAAAGASSNQTNTFNITQQPGQDARALAQAITLEQQRMQAVKARSNMRDNTQ